MSRHDDSIEALSFGVQVASMAWCTNCLQLNNIETEGFLFAGRLIKAKKECSKCGRKEFMGRTPHGCLMVSDGEKL